MRQSIRLGTIRGVEVGVHWSVVVMLALFAWELAEYELPAHPGHAGASDWVAGVIGAVVLLLSLFAHELSHALVARHNGVAVRSITLFVFGGVTLLEGEAHTPGADFRIAAAGPVTSVVLAGVFRGAEALAAWASWRGLPVATLSWLWEINLVLAAFNLLPGAPLDGGRILRAGLWRRWGDRSRASIAAARAGRGVGLALVGIGMVGLFYVGITGLWAALIGYFLYSAAGSEEQYALVRDALARLTVDQVMTPNPPLVTGLTTVSDLLAVFHWYHGEAVGVTDAQGSLTGVVTSKAVRDVPAEQRETMSAAQIAIALAAVPVARPDEPADALFDRMASHEGLPVLVIDDDGQLAGVVSAADLERAAGRVTAGRKRNARRP